MKFCTKCGKELADDAVFCSNCGKSFHEDHESQKQNNLNTGFKPSSVEYDSQKARLSKMFGFFSFVFSPCGIPAIILAILSTKETGGVMNKTAKSGMILGICGLVISAIIYTIFYTLIMMS